MDMRFFFDMVRRTIFGGKLTQRQVDGLNRIIEYRDREWRKMTDSQLAYVLATAAWETAFTMQPIRERGSLAYLKSKKYYPWIGRGLAQITWKSNYAKFGIANDPDKALEWPMSLRILFEGMAMGVFTGRKLGDYVNDDIVDFVNARRVVNGTDRAHKIADIAHKFHSALYLSQAAAIEKQKAETSSQQTKGPDMGNLLSVLFKANPLTSTTGLGLILMNVSGVLALIASGANFFQVVQDKHFQDLMVGVGLMFAKDFNTSGGNPKY
jgi:hypothetical protein